MQDVVCKTWLKLHQDLDDESPHRCQLRLRLPDNITYSAHLQPPVTDHYVTTPFRLFLRIFPSNVNKLTPASLDVIFILKWSSAKALETDPVDILRQMVIIQPVLYDPSTLIMIDRSNMLPLQWSSVTGYFSPQAVLSAKNPVQRTRRRHDGHRLSSSLATRPMSFLLLGIGGRPQIFLLLPRHRDTRLSRVTAAEPSSTRQEHLSSKHPPQFVALASQTHLIDYAETPSRRVNEVFNIENPCQRTTVIYVSHICHKLYPSKTHKYVYQQTSEMCYGV